MHYYIKEHAMLTSKMVKEVLPEGTTIVYSNTLTNYQTGVFVGEFENFPWQEKQIMSGDIIFVTLEFPDSPGYEKLRGGVRGLLKCVVLTVNKVGDMGNEEFEITYRGGVSYYGTKTTKGGVCNDIKIAVDESRLAEKVASNPRSRLLFPST